MLSTTFKAVPGMDEMLNRSSEQWMEQLNAALDANSAKETPAPWLVLPFSSFKPSIEGDLATEHFITMMNRTLLDYRVEKHGESFSAASVLEVWVEGSLPICNLEWDDAESGRLWFQTPLACQVMPRTSNTYALTLTDKARKALLQRFGLDADSDPMTRRRYPIATGSFTLGNIPTEFSLEFSHHVSLTIGLRFHGEWEDEDFFYQGMPFTKAKPFHFRLSPDTGPHPCAVDVSVTNTHCTLRPDQRAWLNIVPGQTWMRYIGSIYDKEMTRRVWLHYGGAACTKTAPDDNCAPTLVLAKDDFVLDGTPCKISFLYRTNGAEHPGLLFARYEWPPTAVKRRVCTAPFGTEPYTFAL